MRVKNEMWLQAIQSSAQIRYILSLITSNEQSLLNTLESLHIKVSTWICDERSATGQRTRASAIPRIQ